MSSDRTRFLAALALFVCWVIGLGAMAVWSARAPRTETATSVSEP